MRVKEDICPVGKSEMLLSKFRKLIHNPQRMFSPFVKQGCKVLEIGCGPGFFTLPLAKMVGNSGKVFALDLQEGMLEILQKRAKLAEVDRQIESVLSSASEFKLAEKVDFVLLFYVIHEVPNPLSVFRKIYEHCHQGTRVYYTEPPFHVDKGKFAEFLEIAQQAGFIVEKKFGILDKTAILRASHV